LRPPSIDAMVRTVLMKRPIPYLLAGAGEQNLKEQHGKTEGIQESAATPSIPRSREWKCRVGTGSLSTLLEPYFTLAERREQ